MLNHASTRTEPTKPLSSLQTCAFPCHRWARVLASAALASTLVACGSSVKLDDVPVVDRTGTAVSTLPRAGVSGVGGGAERRGVSGLEVGGVDLAQPAAMARLIYFDYDSFEVRAEFATVLEAHAKYLAASSTRRAALEGHTDERGGREYNLALGQQRAEAVRRALSLLGVSEAQMEAVSFGEEKPAELGFDEPAFVANRRVELSYR